MTASVAIGLAIACVAAAATSLGWLMKSRGARSSAPMRHNHPWHSVRALLRARWFAAGVVVASAGGLLHIAALALAPLSTVQAVMATGIVVLGVMAERVFGWPVTRRQRVGVALTALGLVALALSVPDLRGAHSSFRAGPMVAFDLALLGASGLLLLASRVGRLRGHDGALIGARLSWAGVPCRSSRRSPGPATAEGDAIAGVCNLSVGLGHGWHRRRRRSWGAQRRRRAR